MVARGIERRPIFVDDDDRLDLLRRLSLVLAETNVTCLAWALMDNHVHLVLRTGAAPLGRAMARILTGHALRFNRRHGRVGHLFQNRYYSRPARSEAELLAVVAYVHRNPLAAGIVASQQALASFPWTGHAALMGEAEPWPFHAVDAALAALGPTKAAARRALAYWVGRDEAPELEAGSEPSEPTPDAAGPPLRGTPSSSAELIETVCGRLGIDPAALASGRRTAPVAAGRAVIACLAVRRGWSLRRLGPDLGVKPTGLYQAVERGRQIIRQRAELSDLE